MQYGPLQYQIFLKNGDATLSQMACVEHEKKHFSLFLWLSLSLSLTHGVALGRMTTLT